MYEINGEAIGHAAECTIRQNLIPPKQVPPMRYLIEADASWSQTFTHAGTFPYYYTFHPGIKGTIIAK